jgi:hypothetical protein
LSKIDDITRELRANSAGATQRYTEAIRKIYIAAVDNLSKEIKTLQTKQAAAGFGYELTIESKTALTKMLRAAVSELQGKIKPFIEGLVAETIQNTNSPYFDILNEAFSLAGIYDVLEEGIIKKVFKKVNTDLVTINFLKTYKKGLTYSKRIWKSSKAFSRDLRNIVNEGLARQRDIIEIARDLQIYVRNDDISLARRYANLDTSPRKPGETLEEWKDRQRQFKRRIPKNIDYRALRIARTMYRGALQDTWIAQSKFTLAVRSFDWVLSPSHERYSICEDIVAGNPWTYETFSFGTPPHPNCLSSVEYNTIPPAQFIGDLQTWVKNPYSNGLNYINEWKNEFYDPFILGNESKITYFSEILQKTNK